MKSSNYGRASWVVQMEFGFAMRSVACGLDKRDAGGNEGRLGSVGLDRWLAWYSPLCERGVTAPGTVNDDGQIGGGE
jgi:hypothetical protein